MYKNIIICVLGAIGTVYVMIHYLMYIFFKDKAACNIPYKTKKGALLTPKELMSLSESEFIKAIIGISILSIIGIITG